MMACKFDIVRWSDYLCNNTNDHMNNSPNKSILIAILLVILGAVSRLIINIPNVSILESLALFGGAYFALKRFAFLIPLAAMFASDFIINNTIARQWFPQHEGLVFFSDYMIWNVVAIILVVLFGKVLLKKISTARVAGGVLGATLIFWGVSNIGAFLSMPIYPRSIAGLITCFEVAIPFLKYSLAGNAFFALVLFGSYEFLSARFPKIQLEYRNI